MKNKKPKQGFAFRNKYPAAFLALLFLIAGFNSQAQYQTIPLYGQSINHFKVTSVFLGPTGCGAPSGLTGIDSSQKQAAIYFDTCNHLFYVYDPALASWDTIHIGAVASGFTTLTKGSTPTSGFTSGRVMRDNAGTLDEYGVAGSSGVLVMTDALSDSILSNATVVTAGTNVTVTGSGTSGSPYVVSASGGGTSTIDTTVTAGSDGQTNFVFASLPSRYLVMVNGAPFTSYTTSGGTTIIVGFSDIVTGDKIRLYQTQ